MTNRVFFFFFWWGWYGELREEEVKDTRDRRDEQCGTVPESGRRGARRGQAEVAGEA